MKIRTTLAVATVTLIIGVPVATGASDGYRPGIQPDAVDRYLGNALRHDDQPDALARYLRNNPNGAATAVLSSGAVAHPDNRAVRPGAVSPVEQADFSGISWESGVVGALGGALIVLLGIVGASAMRERRRLVLR
jgi:hypothetical protein